MRIFAVLCFSLLASLIACKKDEPAQTSRPVAETKLLSDASTLDGAGIFSLLPKETGAFFFWDLSSPAFSRLLDSKWGRTYLTKIGELTRNVPELTKILTAAGLPLDNPDELRKSLREALVYLSSGKNGGLILRTVEGRNIFPALKTAAGNTEGFQELPQETFSFNTVVNNQRLTFTVSSQGDRVLITDSGTSIAEAKGGFNPTTLQRLSQGRASTQERIGFGFFELSSLEEAKEVPLESGFVDISMVDKPAIRLKLKSREPFKGSSTPPSADLLKAFPENPLLFTTFNAGELRELIENCSEEARKKLSDSQFAALRTVRRLAIGARVGPQAALLPVPELIIAAESSEPPTLVEAIISNAVSAIQGFGLPVQPTETQIAGRKVSVIPGALGLSLHVVELEGVVLLSSSQELIARALESGSTIPGELAPSLSSSGVGKLYLSFPELAKILGSARGMAGLSGGATARESLNSTLSEENLKALADLGSLISTLTHEGDLLLGEINYL
jgi:hypothetical protein